MLVADNSGSQAEHLPLMQESIGSFAEKLMASGKSDRVGLVRVSTEAQLLLALSSETERVRGAGSDMFITNGWTALWDGIRLANDSMSDETVIETKGKATQCVERTLRAIVAFTDGGDNNSADEQKSRYSGDGIDTRLEELLKLNVGGTKTPVFTVGIGSEVDETNLTQLSEMSGATYVGVEDMGKLHGALMATAARLRTQVPVCFERARCEDTEARVILTVTSDGTTQTHTLPIALPPSDCRAQPPPETEPKTKPPKPEEPKTKPPKPEEPKTKPPKPEEPKTKPPKKNETPKTQPKKQK
jgi:Mg-chelatase subunit ChlD